MTTEEIIEGNKLIAEFMGGVCELNHKYGASFNGWYNTPANNKKHVAQNFDLIYHSSWDWLMPVVEKIESTDILFNVFGNEVWVADSEYRNTAKGFQIATKSSSKIESVYKAIIEFIKWYNSQPK